MEYPLENNLFILDMLVRLHLVRLLHPWKRYIECRTEMPRALSFPVSGTGTRGNLPKTFCDCFCKNWKCISTEFPNQHVKIHLHFLIYWFFFLHFSTSTFCPPSLMYGMMGWLLELQVAKSFDISRFFALFFLLLTVWVHPSLIPSSTYADTNYHGCFSKPH